VARLKWKKYCLSAVSPDPASGREKKLAHCRPERGTEDGSSWQSSPLSEYQVWTTQSRTARRTVCAPGWVMSFSADRPPLETLIMFFPSWLRTRTPIRKPALRASRRPLTFRPRLEALEGRDVPSTLTVTNTLDDGSAGSLRAEITAAQSGDTIQFAIPTTDPGYNPATGADTITLSSGTEIQIAKNLTIQGPGAGLLTISGDGNVSRIFEVDGATTNVTLSGLSLVNGNGMAFNPFAGGTGVGWSGGGNHTSTSPTAQDGQGGAIWNGGALSISNCVLSDNACGVFSTGAGGAIYNAGSLTITNSTLASNSAGLQYNHGGAGGAIFDAGNLTVTNCNLTANSATDGGGIYCDYRTTTTVTGTTLSNNTAYAGGAIYNDGTTTLSGVTVTGNSAAAGGGIYSDYRSTTTVTGTTLSNNTAYAGGAIDNDGTTTLTGVTVTGNSATDGGGIYDTKYGHLTISSACNVTGNAATVGADLDAIGPVKISKDSTVGVTGP
jgi:predicted outer membrane repeat protein